MPDFTISQSRWLPFDIAQGLEPVETAAPVPRQVMCGPGSGRNQSGEAAVS